MSDSDGINDDINAGMNDVNGADAGHDANDASSERRRRRRRSRPSSEVGTPDPRAWRAVGIVAAAAAVLVIAGLLVPMPSADEGAVSEVQPVDSSTSVCPEPGSTGGALTTSIVTVIPGLAGQDRPGESVIDFLQGQEGDGSGGTVEDDSLVPGADIQGDLAAPGDVARVTADTNRLPALEVRATGGLAPGLIATQTTRDSFSDGRGLASQVCLGPDTTWWFVGGGSVAGRESALVLVNPEQSPAELEVAISGPDGPVSTPRLRGLVVEPRSRVVVRLSREAPRLAAAAWRVTVRQGRVTAALSDVEVEGFVPRGADWIPSSVDPATRVLVPGVKGGLGSRQLLLHAPGELTATVQMRLITAEGSFVPAATPEIEVPGGTVVLVDVGESLQGDDATVDLQSDLPIVAGVRQRHVADDEPESSLEETSFTAGAPLIDSIAATTGLPAERNTSVTVWITVPDDVIEIGQAPLQDAEGDATDSSDMAMPTSGSPAPTSTEAPQGTADEVEKVDVTLSILPVSPEGASMPAAEDITVSVPRGRLVAVDIPRPEGAEWLTAVARVSGGSVVIAHVSQRRTKDGPLVTGYPWRPLRSAVVVPRAVPDPGLAVPGA